MKEKIKLFLDSDLLESYLLGATTTEETLQVERYLSMYPEVRKTYEELQDNLETYAKMHAVKAPEALKERILSSINKESNFKRNFYRMAVAASFAVLISAGSSYFFWN
ncbi:hypothetical protein ACU8V7_17845 [Zobellia nedashkovskayae]